MALISHGVLRIPRYLEMIDLGIIDPVAMPETVHEFGAIAVIDAKRAPGAVGMNYATEKAIALAKANGIGWCSARNITHSGAIGYFAERIAAAGLVAIGMSASKPLMTYHGSRAEAVSTNPLAIAAPSSTNDDPLLLDMSTAAVALGKVMAARDAGREIPEGWGLDENGKRTTDPQTVKVLLPMAGPKGSGLSLMIEVLCSLLVRNAVIAPALSGQAGGGFNGAMIALDPQAFGDEISFRADVHALSMSISELPKAAGTDRILLPGQRGFETARERKSKGIPLSAGTRKNLVTLARSLGAKIPAVLS
ncbi:Ldh family oxidoreductase [Rhizobium sp. AN83]|uniref:Ldh family oxidoreductase n=1 Tax=Rhizobium sp. AN83 TaxID=3035217 RepID=UPI002B25912C|nr:Ldh family oxidoreductase [Rhizobium sp. AN83]